MAEVKTYSPLLIRVIYGVVPISGFGEDDILEFAPDEDAFGEVKGVDGDVTTSKMVAQCGSLNLTLMQSSRANALLWAAYNADLLANGGQGIVPCTVFDENGVGVLATDAARIVRHPDIKFAKMPGPRVWKVRLYGYKAFEGGY